MDRLRRAAVLIRLMEKLREKGSWCGETHVQKASFFLQELMKVPLGFDFILYKHGPFSFDLRDELTGLCADNLVRLEPQYPYGPSILTTELGHRIQTMNSKTLRDYEDRIAFVADKLGPKRVSQLQRLATALYVTRLSKEGASVEERAQQLTTLKPHISLLEAITAVEEVDQIIREAKERLQ